MVISGHLNFFSIEECGLYKHGSDIPKALAPDETFDLIYKWVQKKPMEDTIPWDPSDSKKNLAKCYCHDYYQDEDTGEFLFVLWKSDSDGAGSIWGAQANALTGSSNVKEYTDNYKGSKMIWGRPAYYWIIPKLKTVVSIKVDHSVCDSGLFQEWVTKCITNRVPHKNKKKSETESGQIRFEFTEGKGALDSRYAFRFDVRLRSLNTSSAELANLASRVTRIVRRDTIKLNDGIDDRPKWVKLFDKIPHLPAKPKAKTREIEIRAEAKPTAAEIKKIIEQFAKQERKRTDWNNVGFEVEKGNVVWVDKYRLHANINFTKDESTVFPAADMYVRLSKKRDSLLKEVMAAEKANSKSKKTAAKGGA